jgi:hypothetical protein
VFLFILFLNIYANSFLKRYVDTINKLTFKYNNFSIDNNGKIMEMNNIAKDTNGKKLLLRP